ncbi:uncharacterized protein [Lepisosteus oculatus]|uniref:uncharacterized protein n=1 Tax=Lepisosteus oculatus TaxID=7918 RepID=UPI0037128904
MAEVIRRIAAHLDQPLSGRDQELINFIRQRFSTNLKTDQGYVPVKVTTRNDTTYLLPHEQQKKQNYDRRKDLLSNGFFTPADKAYQNVGTVSLDNVDLFSYCLTSEDQEQLRKQLEKKYVKTAGSSVTLSKFSQEKAKKDEKVKPPTKMIHLQASNGFFLLKTYLEEMVWMKHALHTGRPLAANPSFSAKKILSSKTPSEQNLSGSKDSGKTCTMSINTQAIDPEEEYRLRNVSIRKQEHVAEKLQWIYMMLCGITNMKNRDLKTMVPLSPAYVKGIMKETEILPRSSASSIPPPNTKRQQRSFSLASEDSQSITPDIWETFIHPDSEIKSASIRYTG